MNTAQTQTASILVADPNIDYLQDLAQQVAKSQGATGLLTASNGKEAQIAIGDRTRRIVAIVLNPDIADTNCLSVIRFGKFQRPVTPIFLFKSESLPFDFEQLSHLGVHGVIEKPKTFGDLIKNTSPSHFFFDSNKALEISKKNNELVDQEFLAEDNEFVTIASHEFLSGSKSFFDVYVRVGGGKYIKILQAGDAFNQARLAVYIGKGVKQFFLRKSAQEHFLSYCDQLATSVLKKQNISVEVKTQVVLNHGQETLSFLKNQGLSESNVEYASSFVENTHALVRQIEFPDNQLLNSFMTEFAAQEHSIGVTMVASLLAREMKIESNKMLHVVGLASFFHDIGLYKLNPDWIEVDTATLSSQDLRIYQTHPLVGAEILNSIKGIDPVVIQAVAQHHERRDRQGFPAKMGPGTINKISEIVGIADELIHALKKANKQKNFNVFEECKQRVRNGFSTQIIALFMKTFFPTSKYE